MVSDKSAFGDDEVEKKILEAIRNSPRGTYIEELARELKLNRATIKDRVIRLEAQGKIEAEKKGATKMLYYKEDGN